MFLLDRRRFLELSAAAGALGAASPAFATPQTAEVFTAPAEAAQVDSAIILGEEKAVLVDTQMVAPAAGALADMIAATGRDLETIFVTHYHPDHILGLAVILDRFPNAKAVTHPKIRPLMEKSAAAMLSEYSSNAPAGVFADRAVVPDALDADHILLEGERIEILEPMHGDTDLISAVYVPSIDTLIASDFAYADTHAWVAENQTPEAIETWRTSLSALEAIGAGTVIPGHRAPDSANDASVFAKTRAYLDAWEAAKASAGSAEELKAMMLDGRDGYGLGMAVDRAVAAAYPG